MLHGHEGWGSHFETHCPELQSNIRGLFLQFIFGIFVLAVSYCTIMALKVELEKPRTLQNAVRSIYNNELPSYKMIVRFDNL